MGNEAKDVAAIGHLALVFIKIYTMCKFLFLCAFSILFD